MLQCCEVIASIIGLGALNVRLRCPSLYWGVGVRPVPSVAAPPGFDTCPSQQRMKRHVGRQAAEVARWWSLREGLHAATQVPAQLVGSAATYERRLEPG